MECNSFARKQTFSIESGKAPSGAIQGNEERGTIGATLPSVPDTALYPLNSNNGPAPSNPASTGSVPLTQTVSLKNYLREQEQSYLNKVMQQCDGDKEKAALVLGVSLATLYRKLSGEETKE